MENQKRKKVELLAPAGTYDAFRAAVNAGADAVYLAGKQFGARAFAGNFDDEELIRCIREAHLCGVKINLTVNTLMREEELAALPAFLQRPAEAGLDAVIVQDLGAVQCIRENFPNIAIHASTQMSVTTKEAVRFLADMGVTRVVPARELSLAEITKLKSEIPMEIETFIHGAMCYCYSGKCLLSGYLGGRSGNRGRCAQPCRLPYAVISPDPKEKLDDARKKEYYPLSMRDLCTVRILPALIEAGIDSFKIEGRMKKPEYVAGVVHIYRKYIDLYLSLREEHREKEYEVSERDLRFLKSLYLRSELSEGYYYAKNGRGMITIGEPGYSGADPEVLQRVGEEYVKPVKACRVDGTITLKAGEPAVLELQTKGASAGDVAVRVRGAIVQEAQKAPASAEDVIARISKMGDSVFVPGEITCRIEGSVFAPVKELNALRRDALGSLEEALLLAYNNHSIAERTPYIGGDVPAKEAGSNTAEAACDADQKCIYASVIHAAQAKAALEGGADYLIDDSGSLALPGENTYLAFPYAIRDVSGRFMQQGLQQLLEGKYRGAFVRNMEALSYLRLHGYKGSIIADSSLYCWNTKARKLLSEYAEGYVYPMELDGRELSSVFDGKNNTECAAMLMVYGRVPMMISAGCVRKTEGVCAGTEKGFYYLSDRKKERLPVRTVCGHCQNIIYNAYPLSLHKFTEDRLYRNTDRHLLVFTDESAADTHRITAFYRNAADGHADKRTAEALFLKFTNGHYKKGVD